MEVWAAEAQYTLIGDRVVEVTESVAIRSGLRGLVCGDKGQVGINFVYLLMVGL